MHLICFHSLRTLDRVKGIIYSSEFWRRTVEPGTALLVTSITTALTVGGKGWKSREEVARVPGRNSMLHCLAELQSSAPTFNSGATSGGAPGSVLAMLGALSHMWCHGLNPVGHVQGKPCLPLLPLHLICRGYDSIILGAP